MDPPSAPAAEDTTDLPPNRQISFDARMGSVRSQRDESTRRACAHRLSRKNPPEIGTRNAPSSPRDATPASSSRMEAPMADQNNNPGGTGNAGGSGGSGGFSGTNPQTKPDQGGFDRDKGLGGTGIERERGTVREPQTQPERNKQGGGQGDQGGQSGK